VDSCVLKASGCGSTYTAGELSLGTASPWSLTMNTKVVVGYTENAGIQCDFGSASVTNTLICSDFAITQQPLDCSEYITAISFTDPNQTYSNIAIIVPSDNTLVSFFTNSDTTNCPVDSCVLKASGCASKYTEEG
jgi:hypothetical protein